MATSKNLPDPQQTDAQQKADLDNHSRQVNPGDERYRQSRHQPKPEAPETKDKQKR